MTAREEEPDLRIVRGNPTDSEIVALVAALALLAPPAIAAVPAESGTGAWRDSGRAPIGKPPGAWAPRAREQHQPRARPRRVAAVVH
ncbi:acyl-CoA carboxylase epsilon subunit [Nocardia sp. NPDC057663]|uniref:acyl-CoA carboxylase epsilon subunit n=1 Tax=Nocardia sp. NPDC057663 TaxID=3346201 RepID=UPI00366BDD99